MSYSSPRRTVRAISADARKLCALARDLYNAHPTADARLERLEDEGTPLSLILDDLADEAWNADLREVSTRVMDAYNLLYG